MARQDEEEQAVTTVGAIRQIELERYAREDQSPEARDAFERRLAGDPEARARLDALRTADRRILDRLDVATESARILERLEAPSASARRRWWPVALLAGAAATAALLLIPEPGIPPGTRTKGPARPEKVAPGVPPTLEMYVKDDHGIRRALDGARLTEGDAIQFRYDARGRRFLFMVSIDGRGTISPLYPDLAGESIEVEPDGVHVLDGSIILDDARGPERIYAVFSDLPLAFEDLVGAIERGREDARDVTDLPELSLDREDVDQASVLILKE